MHMENVQRIKYKINACRWKTSLKLMVGHPSHRSYYYCCYYYQFADFFSYSHTLHIILCDARYTNGRTDSCSVSYSLLYDNRKKINKNSWNLLFFFCCSFFFSFLFFLFYFWWWKILIELYMTEAIQYTLFENHGRAYAWLAIFFFLIKFFVPYFTGYCECLHWSESIFFFFSFELLFC